MRKAPEILLFTALLLLAACSREPLQRQPVPRQDLSVAFLDTGQADAALIRTPERETILIDAGRNGQTAAVLRKQGVRQIDLLVLSHAHADHTGGLAAIVDAFPVRELWYTGLDYKPAVRRAIARAGKVEIVSAGTERRFSRLALQVLHPEPNPPRGKTGEVNNRSLVLKAVYGESRYLFPGDCEMGCWEELFKFHRRELRADVLKAAHHGSNNGTNSGVLINVRPKTFVVSCGRDNEFGHPHRIVLTMVDKLGAQLFRTDEQGTIVCGGVACAPER